MDSESPNFVDELKDERSNFVDKSSNSIKEGTISSFF